MDKPDAEPDDFPEEAWLEWWTEDGADADGVIAEQVQESARWAWALRSEEVERMRGVMDDSWLIAAEAARDAALARVEELEGALVDDGRPRLMDEIQRRTKAEAALAAALARVEELEASDE